MLEGVTAGYRVTRDTGSYRGLKGVTSGYRGLQRAARDYKGLQGVTRGYKE